MSTPKPNTTTHGVREYAYAEESIARRARRQFIDCGRAVSMLAYDGARDVYVFDVLN